MSIDVRKEMAFEVSRLLGVDKNKVVDALELPPNPKLGDYALPCFIFSTEFRKNPSEISKDFEKTILNSNKNSRLLNSVKAVGPYLNIFINKAYFVDKIINSITKKDFEDLKSHGEGKTVVIDYSSPNIAKPFGIGHLRSTVIGNALKNICSMLGYRVIGINHLGDWGTQFGKLIVAFKRWGDENELESEPIKYLYKLYVKFHSEAEKNHELEEEARGWFVKLEKNDREAKGLWIHFKKLSMDEFKRIYNRLSVEFDYYTGESFYSDMLDETIDSIREKGITRLSEDALLVPLDDMAPAMLRKKDGSTLYITRDIAAAIYRHSKFNFDLMLYVVGSPQALHFRQMFKVLKKMGFTWVNGMHHVPFGHIRFKDKNMSTRRGNIIFLEDVLDKAKNLALNIIEKKNPDIKNKEVVAEKIGIGSVIFNDLKNYRIKDVTFNWDDILNFNGETGAYLQYTHARINSLLNKFIEKYGFLDLDIATVLCKEGYNICVLLNNFENTVIKAFKDFEPSIISKYLLDLAYQFNSFYNSYKVITDDRELSYSRVLVVMGVKKVLKRGLELLGIEPVEEM